MQTKFIIPDFENNIVNISATLAEYLGCPNGKPTLPCLKAALAKDYKNIVLFILDGLGTHPLGVNLKEDAFLRRHNVKTLTSVFPSTTTNATTTLLTNKYPMEHGWFGWSLYFEELGRAVDLFPEVDSFTGEPIGRGHVRKRLPAQPFYKRAASQFETAVVVPPYWDNDDVNRCTWTTLDELFAGIRKACGRPGRQFIYTYCSEPDSTMHRYGVSSSEARTAIEDLNARVETLWEDARDTLLVITADHGQIDIGGCIELYKDTALTSMLEWPQFLEARAPAFKVRPACRKEFENLFREKYGADFALFETETLIRENYFGGAPVEAHARLLGDFIAVGKTDKVMALTPRSHPFKGHHASLTAEMLVPLILAGKPS